MKTPKIFFCQNNGSQVYEEEHNNSNREWDQQNMRIHCIHTSSAYTLEYIDMHNEA